MEETTRIHIAKVSYDIENTAKKELEKYIKALEIYADDDEIMSDIEIRITELLAERDVRAGGIITNADVKAVRKQLGEPQDFKGDDESEDLEIKFDDEDSRKLYRDVDDAILGGVLSGIAKYFHIDSLWTRLIFIVLLVMSFGTAAFVYLMLWILIQPAKTATEKLRLSGRPVTLASIRTLNEQASEAGSSRVARQHLLNVFLILGGIICAVGAVFALLATIGAVIGLDIYRSNNGYFFINYSSLSDWSVLILFVVSGLLLTTLLSIGSYAAFSKKMTRRLTNMAIVVTIIGIVTFSSGIGIISFERDNNASITGRAVRESSVNVPADFKKVNQLVIDTKDSNINWSDNSADVVVEYIVDSKPRITLTALPGIHPKVSMSSDTTASISLVSDINKKQNNHYGYIQPRLKIYGPALDKLEIKNGTVTYRTNVQSQIQVITQDGTSVFLTGLYNKLSATANGTSSIDASGSSVETLDANTSTNNMILAGTIKSLNVIQPEVCPADTESNNDRVEVSGVTSETISYNGQNLPAKNHTTACGVVTIGKDKNY
jgi:phage shock protein PspC (stress-responsive transcriptional regulator)